MKAVYQILVPNPEEMQVFEARASCCPDLGKPRAMVPVLGEAACPELGRGQWDTELTPGVAGPSVCGNGAHCMYSVCTRIWALGDVKTHEDSKCLDNKM